MKPCETPTLDGTPSHSPATSWGQPLTKHD
jgi:hypothetical protein